MTIIIIIALLSPGPLFELKSWFGKKNTCTLPACTGLCSFFLHLACILTCFKPKYTLIVTGALFHLGQGLTHLVQYLPEDLVQIPDQADLLGM